MFKPIVGGFELNSSIRVNKAFIPKFITKLEPKAMMKKPISETILKRFALLDCLLDSENTRLNFSPTIIKILAPKIVIRNEEIRLIINVKGFCVIIKIIIGKAKVITSICTFRFLNKVINPNFFKSFRDNGSVCNHLKAEPDINELVVNNPKRNKYNIEIIRANRIKKLKMYILPCIGKNRSISSVISKYIMTESKGIITIKKAEINFKNMACVFIYLLFFAHFSSTLA